MKNKKFLILIFFVCVFNYNAVAQVSGLPPKTEDRNVDCGVKTKVDFTKSELKGPSLSVERDVSQNSNTNVAVKASVGLLGGTTTIGQEISDDGLSKLVIGQTKYQEVIENFGKPTVVERTNEIFMAVYQFKKIESERDIKSLIPIVGFFAKPSTQDSVSRSVNFMFEPESGVLVSCTKTDKKDEQQKSPGFFDALKGVKIN